MKKIIILTVTFVVAFALGIMYTSTKKDSIETTNADRVVTYSCADNKNIWAAYSGSDIVNLSLSDGSNMNLNISVSALGARYTNSDESFVFWNKGKTAFMEQNQETTYKNCIEN